MPLLTTCMRDVVSMCLDARVRLVYPAETYGCPSPCRQLGKNVQPLQCVLDYVRSQNDRAVLEKVALCDDNQEIANALYYLPPSLYPDALALTKLLHFESSEETTYFGLTLVANQQSPDLDYDFIRDKLLLRDPTGRDLVVPVRSMVAMLNVVSFASKYGVRLPGSMFDERGGFSFNHPMVLQTFQQNWEKLIGVNNCTAYVTAVVKTVVDELADSVAGVLKRWSDSIDSADVLRIFVTLAPPTRDNARTRRLREVLQGYLTSLPRDKFVRAAEELSVVRRDDPGLAAVLAHFKLERLPPPSVPIRYPELVPYEITPEREAVIMELQG